MLEAVRLKNVDLDYRNHLQAFLNVSASAKKRSGKNEIPVYRTFKKFFDYDKAIKAAKQKPENKSEKYKGLIALAQKQKRKEANDGGEL